MRRHRWRGMMGSGRGVGIRVLIFCALWMAVWAQSSRPGRVNIATGLHSSAYTQSSNYDSYPSSNGANGNTRGEYSRSNCIHTSNGFYDSYNRYFHDRRPWWQVDLGRSHYIYSIKIWGRNGQLIRLYPLTITVDGETCVHVTQQPEWRDFAVNCTRPLYGRVVRLTRGYLQQNYNLNMCEFQIYECNPGYYGMNCGLQCDPGCSSDGCYMNDGKCIKCDPGYYGMNCDLQCDHGCSSDGCYMNDGKCISCKQGHWGDNCQSSCGHCAGDSCDRGTGSCTGCQPGWYGDQCLIQCPSNCLDQKCYQRSGQCLRCKEYFAGPNCTECRRGMYGPDCQYTCSSKTAGCQACERDGHCTDCSGNFKAPDCTVCRKYYYKKDNDKCGQCNNNCVSMICDPKTGKCNECSEGQHGDQCTLPCPQGCKKCEQDGGQCTECNYNLKPPDCNECLDGFYDRTPSTRSCQKCTGTCLNGTICDKTTGHCPACPPGKKGSTCQSNCDRGTYGQNCSRQCGECYYNGYCDNVDGTCASCKTGWQMPLCQKECENGWYGKECKTECGHCKDNKPCHHVNGTCKQCQPGWYPSLCQASCHSGMYGVNCTQKCGTCHNGVACNKTNGHCPCPVGKQPPRCDTDCQNNTYGKECQEKCGHCSGGSACDPISGHCAQGCQPGWIDPTGVQVHLCKTACPEGMYGDKCNLTCGRCQSSSPCHHVTGECSQGCDEGYGGVNCMKGQASKSGPEVLHIVVTILSMLVVVLLAILTTFVCRKRRKTRRSRTKERASYNIRHDEQELSSKEASQPGGRLFVQPEEEEGLYSEVDCPALPSHAPPAAMPLAKVEGAGGSKQKAPKLKRNTPEEMPANTDPNVLTTVNVGRQQTSSEVTPARRRGNELTKSSKQQPAGAEGEVAKPAQEIREQTASGTQQAFFPPTVGHNLKSDSSSSFPSPDLASAFGSNPKEQLDDDSPYEEVAETPSSYEQPTLYVNTTEDSHMYDELQSGSNALYENNGNKRM